MWLNIPGEGCSRVAVRKRSEFLLGVSYGECLRSIYAWLGVERCVGSKEPVRWLEGRGYAHPYREGIVGRGATGRLHNFFCLSPLRVWQSCREGEH